jgi:hypothetical protein
MDDRFGCPCCSGALAGLFAGNLHVQRHAAEAVGSGAGLKRRDFLNASALLAGTLALAPGVALAQTAPVTVFRGGTILTVDAAFSEAEALAIQGQRILAVGSEAEVLAAAGPSARVVELQGRTLLPGFIDAHTHVLAGAVVATIMDYVGMMRFATVDQVLDHLTAVASAKPEGEWIVARNFDPSVQAGVPTLTFAELDAVSTQHPVFVLNASGHLAYANRMAFDLAGVSEVVADPPGGEFVRDAGGRLTGEMKNNTAFLQVANAFSGLANADPVAALVTLLEGWSPLGLTTVSELALGSLSQSPADWAVLQAAGATGKLKARVRAYPFYTIGAEAWDAAGVVPGTDPMVRIAGYKFVADGSNQGFTGLQREPYLGTDQLGLAYMTQDEMTSGVLDRAAKGWPLAIHGNGDAGIDMILNACAALHAAGTDPAALRVRIEHCSMLNDDQIAAMAGLGLSASVLIGHVHYWGVAFRDRVFGPDRAQLLGRCESMTKAGIGVSLHSDFMVTDPDPLHMIEMAVTRTTWKEPEFVLNPAERISVETAIRAVTSEAAWQLHSEHEVGSLEPGKFADLVILDADPRKVDPDRIKSIAVQATWLNGVRVFSAIG